MSAEWAAPYAAPAYGVWLTLLLFAWFVVWCAAVYTHGRPFNAALLEKAAGYTDDASFANVAMWILLTATATLLLKLLIISAWWDDDESSQSCSDSFACAEVRHEVASVWPLTRQTLDFIETVALLTLIGLCPTTIISKLG